MRFALAAILLILTGCGGGHLASLHAVRIESGDQIDLLPLNRFGPPKECDLIVSITGRCSTVTYPAHFELTADRLVLVTFNEFGSRTFLAEYSRSGLVLETGQLWRGVRPADFYLAFQLAFDNSVSARFLDDGSTIAEVEIHEHESPHRTIRFLGTGALVKFSGERCAR